MRRPSTRMTWVCGSTRAPNRRTISPSTSTRPAPISSSQCRRLPTPGGGEHLLQPDAAGDVGQGVARPSSRNSRRPGRWRPGPPVLAAAGPRGRAAPAALRHGRAGSCWQLLGLVQVLGQERGQRRAGRPGWPGRAAPGSSRWCRNRIAPVSGSVPSSAIRPRSTSVRITPSQLTPADRRHPGPADRLPVGDHRQRLQRRLGEPDLLAVADEPLDHRGALLAGVEAPAAGDLPQVEPAALVGVGGGQRAQRRGDLVAAAARAPGPARSSGTGSSATSRIASRLARRPGPRATVARRRRARRRAGQSGAAGWLAGAGQPGRCPAG